MVPQNPPVGCRSLGGLIGITLILSCPISQGQSSSNSQSQTSAKTPAASAPAANGSGTSVAASAKSAAQAPGQALNQSVQSIQTSTTSTVSSSMTTVSDAAQTNVQNGVKSLTNSIFGKKAKPAQPTTTAGQAVAPNATASPNTVLTPASPASAAASAAASSPSIQDEGDGKHFVMTTPGQKDALELSLQAGSKNVYLEESSGDKYIVLPSGEIKHIPHKSAAN